MGQISKPLVRERFAKQTLLMKGNVTQHCLNRWSGNQSEPEGNQTVPPLDPQGNKAYQGTVW